MTIEELLIAWIGAGLPGVNVSGSVPHPLPDEFITVERVDGAEVDHIPSAQIRVYSWSTSRAAAAALAARVIPRVLQSVSEPEISRCALTANYNNPDLETHKPRYVASFSVTYLF